MSAEEWYGVAITLVLLGVIALTVWRYGRDD